MFLTLINFSLVFCLKKKNDFKTKDKLKNIQNQIPIYKS